MLYSNLIVVIVSISTISSTNGIPKTSLTNQHLLDRRGNLVLGWSITSDRKSIEIELLANCTGYVGISFSKGRLYEPDAMADIILAGYDDALEAGYIEDRWVDLSVPKHIPGGSLDRHEDVELLLAGYRRPWTIVRFRRKLDTGDNQDLPIKTGRVGIGWTFADSDDTTVTHRISDSGKSYVQLIPSIY